jgi:hypothetical protein
MHKILASVFLSLCKHFFSEDGTKNRFTLPERTGNVDDPFVEYLAKNVFVDIDFHHIMAPPLVSPDMAFFRSREEIFGLEIKTVKNITSGINFNSTPPCGRILIEIDNIESEVPCYYLFVQLDEHGGEQEIGHMMMVDGNFINKDFDLYLAAVGEREKRIDLGTYKDGMDRQRPMFVFPNPLSIKGLRAERSTLISSINFGEQKRNYYEQVSLVAKIRREIEEPTFYAYQAVRQLVNPIETPDRKTATKIRNKLKVSMQSEIFNGQ